MNKVLLIILALLVMIPSSLAVCTVDFTSEGNYSSGNIATWEASCSENTERNSEFIMLWYDGSGNNIHNNTGTTPNAVNEFFFGSFQFGDSFTTLNGNITLTGTNLEGFAYYNVSTPEPDVLTIQNIVSQPAFYLGRIGSTEFDLVNGGGSLVNNAECTIHVFDELNVPVLAGGQFKTYDGEGAYIDLVDHTKFKEDQSYLYEIHCNCLPTNSSSPCYNEDGETLSAKSTSTQIAFQTSEWLTNVSTITDKSSYAMNDIISICANITNVGPQQRTVIEIDYSFRCDNSDGSSQFRSILAEASELRGISKPNSQLQCHDFTIPFYEIIEKGNNYCYASTDVTVIDEAKNKLITYSTTSSEFMIDYLSIHPKVDWSKTDDAQYQATLSLTDYNVGTKNVHLIVNDLLYNDDEPVALDSFTVTYSNGSAIPYSTGSFIHEHIERKDNQNFILNAIELEINNVNTNLSESFTITLNTDGTEVGLKMIALIMGLGLLSFFFLVFSFNLSNDHFVLKFMLLFFAIFPLILIPAAIEGGFDAIKESFYKIPVWFFRFFVAYIMTYFVWFWLKKNDKICRALGIK